MLYNLQETILLYWMYCLFQKTKAPLQSAIMHLSSQTTSSIAIALLGAVIWMDKRILEA